MNRGGAVGATPGKTPLKDGGNPVEIGRATKSGRKVKRPAHFDDSPDTKKTGSCLEDVSPKRKEVPEAVKKSARKTILKSVEDSPKKNGESEVEVPKKSARKTLMKQDSREEEPEKAQKTISRRTMTAASNKEDSPEPETMKKSARKTLLKSAVKSSPLEQDTPKKDKPETEPPQKSVKKVEPAEDETPAGPGVSRTGRKIKVPAHLKEFEDVVVASPKKEVPDKSASRKSFAPVVKKQEPEEKLAPKTPGRGRSLAVSRKAAEPDLEETKGLAKTPRRGKSLAVKMDEDDDPLAIPPSSEVASPKKVKQPSPVTAAVEPVKVADLAPKTPKRGKSLAPEATKSPVMEDKLPAKTPSKRGKPMAAPVLIASPEKAPKTPKVIRLVEDTAEPVSRSGRKIKPKKYFGEFEEDEAGPVVAKVASPIKTVAKSSPVVKKESPPKKASPVKRHQVAEKADESPKKKPKLEPKITTDEAKKLDKISPNTEERQITKRGVNDHHHQLVKEETLPKEEPAEQTSEKMDSDPVEEKQADEEKPKRSRKTLPAVLIETLPEPEKPVELQEKPKRDRKTLPAPSHDEEEELPKASKTPVARRMTTALIATEDAGSSRSGRKIKPKKFFGEEEEETKAAKPKATASSPVNGGGRGKRKTQAAELDKESVETKETPVQAVKEAPKAEVEQCPSREEILAVVGAVDPVKESDQNVEQMMEELHTETQVETKRDDGGDQPTPMEVDDQPEVAVVGNVQETTGDNHPQEELDAAAPVVESVPMSTDDDVPAEQPKPEDEIQPVEPVAEDSNQEPDAAEDEESTRPEPETLESALEENFQETSVPQTSPAPCPPTEEVPNDPAPLPEDPPLVEQSAPEELQTTTAPAEELQSMPEPDPELESKQIAEDPEPFDGVPEQLMANDEAVQEQADPIPAAESTNQAAELSTSSSFSEVLMVEDDPVEQPSAVADDSKGQQYESVEFLELSGVSTAANEHPIDEVPIESTNGQEQQQQQAKEQLQNRITTPELEDDLDNIEVPPMDDIDDEKEEELLEDVPEPTDESFLERDRDNESIIVIPDTPKPPKSEITEDFELGDKTPTPQTSQVTVARVELPPSPIIMKELVPSTPKTPESTASKTTTCSPDKPEDQEQANVPLDEVIEIPDSPIVMLKPELTDCKPGSATSTPLRMGSKKSAKDRLIENNRKRSLSVSDAEMVKKNVTFHSPANSTILVDTLDERLKKKNESASKPSQGHRKRSFSEHKDPRQVTSDGAKPAKISKLPNFKNIHQQQFNRMESIEEFHNRKIQRAREILANSAVKSPAATSLVRSDRPPLQKSSSVPPKSPHRSGNGTTSSSASKSGIARPHKIPKPTELHKPLSDAERQEKRQKQFQAAFKPKTDSGTAAAGSDKDTPDAARRVIEQSRHKQNQILKGVRTNKRFELLMKFRDAQE
ncbi:titin-like [Ochlerotatus camptorhynchus]|uniref:titin-like n=1 Tax=Ochlerotatus camptorhynchus TaxID=644619 RepID=UPI0031DEE1A4